MDWSSSADGLSQRATIVFEGSKKTRLSRGAEDIGRVGRVLVFKSFFFCNSLNGCYE